MRLLVCGGRHFDDWRLFSSAIAKALDWVAVDEDDSTWLPPLGSVIIHGGAKGADALADGWAITHWCGLEVYPADWKKHGKAAGPIRNQRMIDEGKPDAVLAFPGGRGTADLIRRAREAGIKVIEAL